MIFQGSFQDSFVGYTTRLYDALKKAPINFIEKLSLALMESCQNKTNIFICGNGGSSANAMHIANDFVYPVSKQFGCGLKIHALSDNTSTLTCLGNDEGYENIFSYQLAVYANTGDILIVLSGSGNSPNIIKVLETANTMGLQTFGILGGCGGKARNHCSTAIVFEGADMQISEDTQLIVFHIIMQRLFKAFQEKLGSA